MNQFVRYYRYPHFHWAAAINDLLTGIDTSKNTTIVDAPCGDGAVTYWLIRRHFGYRYELYDISERSIRIASRLVKLNKLGTSLVAVDKRDIFAIDTGPTTNDVWLLINSLYLLPSIDVLLDRLKPRMRHIIGLFPYIEHRNYRCFLKMDAKMNISAMDKERTVSFFQEHGYDLQAIREVTFVASNCIKTKLLRQVLQFLITPFEYVVPKESPCYWIGLFSRG